MGHEIRHTYIFLLSNHVIIFFAGVANHIRRNLVTEYRQTGVLGTANFVWNALTDWRPPKVKNPFPPVYLASRPAQRRKETRPPARKRPQRPPKGHRRRKRPGKVKEDQGRKQFVRHSLPNVEPAGQQDYQTQQSGGHNIESQYHNSHHDYNNNNEWTRKPMPQESIPDGFKWMKHTRVRDPQTEFRRRTENVLWKRLGIQRPQERLLRPPLSHTPYFYYQPPMASRPT